MSLKLKFSDLQIISCKFSAIFLSKSLIRILLQRKLTLTNGKIKFEVFYNSFWSNFLKHPVHKDKSLQCRNLFLLFANNASQLKILQTIDLVKKD